MIPSMPGALRCPICREDVTHDAPQAAFWSPGVRKMRCHNGCRILAVTEFDKERGMVVTAGRPRLSWLWRPWPKRRPDYATSVQ